MRSTALREILEGLACLDADDKAKRQFSRLVMAVGAAYGVVGLDHAERVDFALRLLMLRTSRPTVRDRLIARYEISRRQAYRVIHEAQQLCQKRVSSGTNPGLNVVEDI